MNVQRVRRRALLGVMVGFLAATSGLLAQARPAGAQVVDPDADVAALLGRLGA